MLKVPAHDPQRASRLPYRSIHGLVYFHGVTGTHGYILSAAWGESGRRPIFCGRGRLSSFRLAPIWRVNCFRAGHLPAGGRQGVQGFGSWHTAYCVPSVSDPLRLVVIPQVQGVLDVVGQRAWGVSFQGGVGSYIPYRIL